MEEFQHFDDKVSMIVAIVFSLIMFAFSISAFVMIGNGSLKEYSLLIPILGSVGAWCFITAFPLCGMALNTWLYLRKKRCIQKRKGPLRRVRFSSLLEIHEKSDQSIDVESNNLHQELAETKTGNTQEESNQAGVQNPGEIPV